MNATPNSGSPYKITGGSLNFNHPSYVVRQADKDLCDWLKRGEFCYVLNSRQMGKSSLRIQTMYRLRTKGIACAEVDLMGIDNYQTTPEKWYGGIVRELTSSLELKLNSLTWWREHKDLAPMQRFNEFLEKVVLAEASQNVVIFVDEIDTVLKLEFKDDFFGLIRACYEKRASSEMYKHLSFVLLGVATPSDLIRDTSRTPFNIGQAIELNGFQLSEAQPLVKGLKGKASNPQSVLREVLAWTNGQPFLTQKLCHLLWISSSLIESGDEAKEIEKLVQKCVIENWETHDEPEHLKTIRDRLLRSEQFAIRLLSLYQEILKTSEIKIDGSSEQMELRLSGLVVEQEGKLRVYNHIYASVFNEIWVDTALSKLRPSAYAEALRAWLTSGCQDESRLLQGQALQDALTWATGKSLSDQDYQFLAASQEGENRAIQTILNAEKQARQLLHAANQEAQKRIRIGSAILAVSIVGATMAGVWAYNSLKQVQIARLDQAAVSNLRQFESGSGEIEALLSAMQTGQELKSLVKNRPLDQYPVTSPLFTLQQILAQIQERNQIQHPGGVTSIAFSPDEQLIATGSNDGIARLWNKQGNLIQEFKGHQSYVGGVVFSPDGQLIATGSNDGIARLWNKQGNLIQEFKGHQDRVSSVAFSPDGQLVATASWDGSARLWDKQGNLVRQLIVQSYSARQSEGFLNFVWSVAFSPDGQLIATGSNDGVRLWNKQGQIVGKSKRHTGDVTSVAFSPNGQLIATGSKDGIAILWDNQGKFIRGLKGHQNNVWSVAFSPDGQFIATGSSDGTTRLWDNQGDFIQELEGHQGDITSVTFSPIRQLLATGSTDGTVRLWDKQRGTSKELKAHKYDVTSIVFSPDGQMLATDSWEEGGNSLLWDKQGNFIKKLEGTNVTFSPDEQLIVTGSAYNPTVRLWNRQGNLINEFQGHQKWISSVTFSPDGQLIATGSGDGIARLWNKQGHLIQELKGHQDAVTSVTFSPDGQFIATSSYDQTVRLWYKEGNFIKKLEGTNATFSPDGQLIATGSGDGIARLWNKQGHLIQELKGHQKWISSVIFSPDGQRIATGSGDGTIHLWDKQGNSIQKLKGHQGAVTSVTFSPDGQLIATSSDDNTARLWNKQGDPISEFEGHRDTVNSVTFSPDGQVIATASSDGTTRLWQVEGLDQLLVRGCDWLKDYLATHPNDLEILESCRK
jgi:WD40 repeat protein